MAPSVAGGPESDDSALLYVPAIEPETDTLAAALAYAEAGWYVLPVKPGKNAGSVLRKGWPAKTTRDAQVIASWFAGTNHAIALHCGRSGALVFDVDDPDKLPDDLRIEFERAPYQSSRHEQSGRGHYTFAMPPGRVIGNSTGHLGKDWGEVRGLNGIIVVAPSEHSQAAEGGEYRWQRTGPVPQLSKRIAAQLHDTSPADDAASDAVVQQFVAEHTSATAKELFGSVVFTMQQEIGRGASRHDTAVSAVTWAMKEARAGYYPAKTALQKLRQIFIEAKMREPISKRQGPKLTEREAISEWDGIRSWGIGQALAADINAVHQRVAKMNHQKPKETPQLQRIKGGEVTDPSPNGKPETNGDTADFEPSPTAIRGDTFILDDPKDVPTLWGTGNQVLWAEGEALMIASLPGLCKTTLAGLLVRAQLGLGDGNVLGLDVRQIDGTILYLAMDRPPQIGRSMSRQFTEADRKVLRDRLVVRKGPPPNDFATDTAMLTQLAKQHDASVVYVDSLKDGVVGLADDKQGAAYNRARQQLTAEGIQVCELHHCRKTLQGNEQSKALSEIYGSIWLTAGAGSVVLLSGESGDAVISFEHVKPVLETVGPYRLIHDQETGQVTVDESADLLEVMKGRGPEGLTVLSAACLMFDTDKPTRAQKERVRRKLDRYVEKELATVCGGDTKGGPPANYFSA